MPTVMLHTGLAYGDDKLKTIYGPAVMANRTLCPAGACPNQGVVRLLIAV